MKEKLWNKHLCLKKRKERRLTQSSYNKHAEVNFYHLFEQMLAVAGEAQLQLNLLKSQGSV